MKDYGRLENIQDKLNRMRRESRDPNFTQYLNQMQTVLDRQSGSARYLEQDIDQKYKQYLQYFPVAQLGQPTAGEAVSRPGAAAGGRLENIQQKLNKLRQESGDPNFTQYLEQMQTVLNNQTQSAMCLEQDIDSKYEQYLQYFPNVQPQPVMQPEQPVQAQPISQGASLAAPKRQTSMEFKIGADVFCVIGILFILIALVMMGINYMGDLFKGVCLYVIAGVLILVSELILCKRAEKLSHGITGLGICGLFASTMINSVLWENFNNIVAAVITVGVTLLAVLISRKKDSVILKVISFLGCYISFWPASGLGSNVDFAVLTAVLFAVGIVSVLVPAKKNELGVHITHLVTNTVFTLSFAFRGWYYDTDMRLCCLFVLSNILLIGLNFNAMMKCVQKKKEAGVYCSETDFVVVYGIMLFLQSVAYVACTASVIDAAYEMNWGMEGEVWRHICMAMYLIPALVVFLLFIKKQIKWVQYYAVIITAFMAYVIYGSETESVICILSIFIVTKLLSRVKALRVGDIVVTSVTALVSLGYIGGEEWYSVAFLTAFVLSVLTLCYYKVFHQTIITFVTVFFMMSKMWGMSLMPSAIVGVLFLFLLIFNHVKFLRDKWQKVYNYINLVMMALWNLSALFVQDYFNSAILALLGTAVIVLVFRKKYEMGFEQKYLFLMMFWTYMALTSGIEMAVIISSIMMVIAILSVIIGFVSKQKAVRVYGLILSILVSLKIMFYDFYSTPIMERMLLFFVVGVIILAISCIYIILEKKMANRGETL